MKDINLVGPPGIQEDNKTKEKTHSKPTSEQSQSKRKSKVESKVAPAKSRPKAQVQESPNAEKPEKKQKVAPKRKKFIKVLKIIGIAYLALTLLYIGGDYLYTNFIKDSSFISKITQKLTAHKKSPQQPKLYTQYLSQIRNGNLNIKAAATVLSSFSSDIFIETMNISEQSLEGKIYFIEKMNASNYEQTLINQQTGLQIKNFRIQDLEGFLPFSWNVYLYLNVSETIIAQKIAGYRLVSDKRLSKILSASAKQNGVKITKFWISSPDRTVIRNCKIQGQGKVANLANFFDHLRKANINLSYNHIDLQTDKQEALIDFKIKGNIYPESK